MSAVHVDVSFTMMTLSASAGSSSTCAETLCECSPPPSAVFTLASEWLCELALPAGSIVTLTL
jgi:hypothetical protein